MKKTPGHRQFIQVIGSIVFKSWPEINKPGQYVGTFNPAVELSYGKGLLTLTNRAIQSKLRAQVRNFKKFSISEVVL